MAIKLRKGAAGRGRRGEGEGGLGAIRLFSEGYIRGFKESRVPDTQPLNHKPLRLTGVPGGRVPGAAGPGLSDRRTRTANTRTRPAREEHASCPGRACVWRAS